MRTTIRSVPLLIAALLTSACDAEDSHVPSAGPPPVSGGTLLVTGDGLFAIASDPDRASIHVVDLAAREERHRIVLGEHDEPGRSVEGADGRIHVVLRRAGDVLTLDRSSGEIVQRFPVCRAPRGIDVVPETGNIVVACAEGVLVELTAIGEVTRTITLEPDLRDVVARGGDRFFVSRFRSAELLLVEGGAIIERMRPPQTAFLGFLSVAAVPTVAWRMQAHPDGAIMVHQLTTSTQLGTVGVPSGVYYGGPIAGGGCAIAVVHAAVTVFDVVGGPRSAAIEGASLVVDAAVDGSQIHLAAASEVGNMAPLNGVRSLSSAALGGVPTCALPVDPYPDTPAAAIAVAVTRSGLRVTQYRDPAMLRVDGGGSGMDDIALSGGRAQHLGHALFHEAAGTGATCASCHPEGGDDGHRWLFDTGTRRTQTLNGGILATAPFHWAGDVAGLRAVMYGTFVGRMGGVAPRGYEIESFAAWMDELPALPGPAPDIAAIDRGRIAFDRAGCAGCHSGELGTNNTSMDVLTGGAFQVPALQEVVYHAPYFHDGSAATLSDVLMTHGEGRALSEGDRSDVEAYLRSR